MCLCNQGEYPKDSIPSTFSFQDFIVIREKANYFSTEGGITISLGNCLQEQGNHWSFPPEELKQGRPSCAQWLYSQLPEGRDALGGVSQERSFQSRLVLSYSSDLPQTLSSPPASASRMPGLQACASIFNQGFSFLSVYSIACIRVSPGPGSPNKLGSATILDRPTKETRDSERGRGRHANVQ